MHQIAKINHCETSILGVNEIAVKLVERPGRGATGQRRARLYPLPQVRWIPTFPSNRRLFAAAWCAPRCENEGRRAGAESCLRHRLRHPTLRDAELLKKLAQKNRVLLPQVERLALPLSWPTPGPVAIGNWRTTERLRNRLTSACFR